VTKLCPEKYRCEKCNKNYDSRNGLWKHSKNCSKKICHENKFEIIKKPDEVCELKEIMKYLMKENSEMKTIMLKVIENGTTNNTNNINNTTNNTNSHNKAFNLNFFLNETCKDAMNIGDFVDSLKIQLLDLENIGEVGYIEGISNIIVKNLKALDITKRPVHCTDKKRETMYIKDADKWEKDEDKTHMHKLIKKVVSQNVKMFAKFREVHPDCNKYHSKFSDQYNKIIYESMGGKGDNDFEKNEKIIKNVLKEVVVDKNI
jgi:Txe/YoeB family toxin of Txe-Axe toxin-antitoxin module